MLFGLDESYYAVLGVQLQLPSIRMILCTVGGRVLDDQAVFQGMMPAPEEVVQTIADYATNVQSRFADRQLLGVGIASPGFTDPATGDIISIGRVANWEDFPICRRIEATLGLPVTIANDVDCMAFAEFQYTRKSFDNNLAYLGFDEGVKVSLFLNGELYKGSLSNTGLIKSQFLRVSGGVVSAEDQHSILTISGINKIFEREIALLSPQEREQYGYMLEATYRERLAMIFDGASKGLSLCDKLAQTLNIVLASAATNVIYLIQPDTMVIGGVLGGMPEGLFAKLSRLIQEELPEFFADRVQIEQAQLISPNSSALGATYHFIESYLMSNTFTLDSVAKSDTIK